MRATAGGRVWTMITYFSLLPGSPPPPPSLLASHTLSALVLSIIPMRVNGQTKYPKIKWKFPHPDPDPDPGPYKQNTSKLNSSFSFFSQLFMFCSYFLFHGPQRMMGVPQIRRPQWSPVVVFETLTPQTNERSLSWQQEGSYDRKPERKAREREKRVMDATMGSALPLGWWLRKRGHVGEG